MTPLEVALKKVNGLSVSLHRGGGLRFSNRQGWDLSLKEEPVLLLGYPVKSEGKSVSLFSCVGYFPCTDYPVAFGDKIDVFGLCNGVVCLFFEGRILDVTPSSINIPFTSDGVIEVVK